MKANTLIKKSWSVLPIGESGVKRITYEGFYTYQGKRYDYKHRCVYLIRPVDVAQLKKYKENLVSLVEELVKEEGTSSTFHFYADDSAMEHGFDGWGFTVKKISGLYGLVSSYNNVHGWREVYKGDEMSNALHWLNHSYIRNTPKCLSDEQILKLLNNGTHKSFRIGLKLELKDVTIGLINWGDIAYLEKGDVQNWLDRGIINEDALTTLLSLEGTSKNVNKYFKKFKKRLRTVFTKT